MSTTVREAESDEDIAACHAVLSQLRPHVPREGFVARVRRMQGTGYHLACAERAGVVHGVAGYRYLEQMVRGRVLYVDDLVTDSASRSEGVGRALLSWLTAQATAAGCTCLELDSGVHRPAAHRFYFRERMEIVGFHFNRKLEIED